MYCAHIPSMKTVPNCQSDGMVRCRFRGLWPRLAELILPILFRNATFRFVPAAGYSMSNRSEEVTELGYVRFSCLQNGFSKIPASKQKILGADTSEDKF